MGGGALTHQPNHRIMTPSTNREELCPAKSLACRHAAAVSFSVYTTEGHACSWFLWQISVCDAYLSFDLEADSFKLLPRQDARDANMFWPQQSNFQCRMKGIPHRAISVEAANAGANDGAACSRSVAANHVHTTGTGKVNSSSIEFANVAAGIGSGPAITEFRPQQLP